MSMSSNSHMSHQAFALCVINSGLYSFNLSYLSFTSMEAWRVLADLQKTDVQCYLKLVGAADKMEDISIVDDNAQEEADYSPDQDQGGSDSCNTSIEKV
jgi:hypothetical protein